MRTLRLSELSPDPLPTGPFYHRSGTLLVTEGEPLLPEVRERMLASGIAALLVPDPGEDGKRVRALAIARQVLLRDIADGTPLRAELRDASGRLLVPPGTILDADTRRLLDENGIRGFYVRRSAAELGLDELEMFQSLGRQEAPEPLPVDEEPLRTGDRRLGKEWTEGMLRSWIEPPSHSSAPPFTECVSDEHRLTLRGPAHRARYLDLYATLHREVAQLYDRLKSLPSESVKPAEGIVRRLLGALSVDRELLLNLVNWKARGSYLPSHGLHVAMLAAGMGTALRRSHDEVFELALTGLLARVGMLRVPEAILEKPGPLTSAETAEVRRAPAMGLALLRKIDWLPVRVVLGAWQCMERPDGSGYPQGLIRERIHRVAAVVSVADVFDALLAARPFRAATLPYRAMETLLRLVREGKLDGQVVRAMLDTVSLFPLGSWVELSDGRIARVVGANPGAHTRPLVTAMFRADGCPLPAERIDLAAVPTPSIVRATAREDLDAGTLAGW